MKKNEEVDVTRATIRKSAEQYAIEILGIDQYIKNKTAAKSIIKYYMAGANQLILMQKGIMVV